MTELGRGTLRMARPPDKLESVAFPGQQEPRKLILYGVS